MEPTTIIAAASVAQGVMGFKGNRAAARQAQVVAEYNAQVRENELVLTQRARRDQEAALRKQSEPSWGAKSFYSKVWHTNVRQCFAGSCGHLF